MTSKLEDLFAFQLDTIYSGMDGYEPYKSGGTEDDTKGSYEYFKQLRKGADVKSA